ncbi:unnamed protein product [Microthlaspi erraticum]|uniref:F-box domain-containing protein n=1 Tax=Microthlaspi erraticum TaxID=1685480 RepID=A0A6D2ICJ0_9BRAS|nr:unnamed protein product [Microthlaspi erraticum]
MDGKGKSNQARSKGLSSTLNEDRLSQLPDPLIIQILDHLYTKQAAKTSVLSKRWRHLWLWVSSFDLTSLRFTDFKAFVSVGDRIFDSTRASRIHKLRLRLFNETEDRLYSVKDVSFLTSWLDAAAKRKIQHLDLHLCECDKSHFYMKPLNFYHCETLVCLKLSDVALDDASAHFVSFPCLKKMRLLENVYPSEATFEKLVSSCPVLEEFEVHILGEDAKVFRVRSQSLKRLTLIRDHSYSSNSLVPGVVVDAPLLSCLSINDLASESFLVDNLVPRAKLGITITFGSGYIDEIVKRSRIRSFLLGVSKVGDMTLCAYTFQLLCDYSEFEPLPRFGYMSRLGVDLRVSYFKWLPTFLETCRNMKSLILTWDSHDGEMSPKRRIINEASEVLVREFSNPQETYSPFGGAFNKRNDTQRPS